MLLKTLLLNKNKKKSNDAIEPVIVNLETMGRISLDGRLKRITADDMAHQSNISIPKGGSAPGRISLDGTQNIVNALLKDIDTENTDGDLADVMLSRRLSLDGNLPEAGLQPNEQDELGIKRKIPGLEGVVHIGDKLNLPVIPGFCGSAGWELKKGLPPSKKNQQRKENQDAYVIYAPLPSSPNQMFFAVFDGHGQEGRKISHFVRDTVPRILMESFRGIEYGTALSVPEKQRRVAHKLRFDAFKKAFGAAEKGLGSSDIDHVFSGTTGVACWLLNADLYCGWVGDSRAVIGRKVDDKKAAVAENKLYFEAIDISYDQKPTRVDEKKRVKAAGARVTRWKKDLGPVRVWLPKDWIPGLAMTRSIGDTILTQYGVAPVPEFTYTRLAENDSFIVLASDGVWEFMTSQEVVNFVAKLRANGIHPNDAADILVAEAVRRWRANEVVVDDTTAIVIYTDFGPDEDQYRDNTGRMFFGKPPPSAATLNTPQQVCDDGQLIPFHPKNDTVG